MVSNPYQFSSKTGFFAGPGHGRRGECDDEVRPRAVAGRIALDAGRLVAEAR